MKSILGIITGSLKLQLALALGATAVVGAVGSMTFGAWNVGSDAGNAYSKAKTAVNLTLSDASAATTADLYPGGSGDVKVKVTNPNPFAVTITNVSAAAGSIVSDAGATCNSATGVSFTNQTGLSLSLAAGATSTFTLSGAAAMTNASANACQGAIFTIPVSITATS